MTSDSSTNASLEDQTKKRMGINLIFTAATLAILLLVGFGVAYLSLTLLYSEKQDDTWAIVYLNLESELAQISQKLEKQSWADHSIPLTASLLNQRQPDLIMRIDNYQQQKLTAILGSIEGSDIEGSERLFPQNGFRRFHVWQYAGEEFLVRSTKADTAQAVLNPNLGIEDKDHLLLWRVSSTSWLQGLSNGKSPLGIYMINRSGQLLYSNRSEITQENLSSRGLIQEFVNAPLKRLQIELTEDDVPIHGTFNEINNSNLVLFLEMSKDLAMEPVYRMAYTLMTILSFLIFAVFLFVQWPLRRLIQPLKELIWLTSEIRTGNYQVRTKLKGIGELQNLHEAFDDMANSLMEKEAALEQYIEDQKEAVRLQGELDVAHSIQDNLLSKIDIPKHIDMDLGVFYRPAQECAGDWYGYFHIPATDEVIVAQADVSGHGVGSALYTAMIASLFEDVCQESKESFPVEPFLRRLNHVFIKTGKSQWHATFTIIKFKPKDLSINITCAGSTPFIQLRKGEKGQEATFNSLQSDPIGLLKDPSLQSKELDVQKGDLFFLFTDGLTEAQNPKKRMYGQKRLKLTLQKFGDEKSSKLIEKTMAHWKGFVGDESQEDDICLVALRI